MIVRPTLIGFSVAPITATVFGPKIASSGCALRVQHVVRQVHIRPLVFVTHPHSPGYWTLDGAWPRFAWLSNVSARPRGFETFLLRPVSLGMAHPPPALR